MDKERLHYIDVAKGLLILMVVYGHIYGVMRVYGIENDFTEGLRHSLNVFIPFYMPAFFVITGYCSDFRKPFFTLLIQSLKTIIIPGIILSFLLNIRNVNGEYVCTFFKSILLYGGDYWFLSSLFLARIVYWIICNKLIQMRSQIIAGMILFIMGYAFGMLYHGIEIWWFVRAMILAPFIGVGIILKRQNIKRVNIFIVSFFVTLLITIFLSHLSVLERDCFYHVPAVTQMLMNINPTMFIPFVLLSITGSVMVVELSKKISANRFFEFIGRNSLIVYCVHAPILRFFIRFLAVNDNIGGIVLAYIATIFLCCIISFFLNLRYVKVLIGKF